ncbi:hypothetical protein JYU14_05010, partial [Simkania negevensis]|nr:hypothetical protein [Simkania negevensis]
MLKVESKDRKKLTVRMQETSSFWTTTMFKALVAALAMHFAAFLAVDIKRNSHKEKQPLPPISVEIDIGSQVVN